MTALGYYSLLHAREVSNWLLFGRPGGGGVSMEIGVGLIGEGELGIDGIGFLGKVSGGGGGGFGWYCAGGALPWYA